MSKDIKPRVVTGPGARFHFTPEYLAANGGAIAGIVAEPDEDDGQPDEAQEWADFDPDC